MLKSIGKFFLSLYTDSEWDGDSAKVVGFGLVVVGIVGFFRGVSGFEWMIGTGAAMIASGKWSSKG